ncbi:echinoderm microtubule-associated protein-like CG42247, partial [Diaphorina citri]|uniref:Echinoderm microtubule-associated protein-like CG42247 n=1 Tax=Diaphorina citri TaxID=121845 RepID=A0A3Q0IZE3_DIACI
MANESVLVPPMNQNQDKTDSELEDEEVDEAVNTRPRPNTVLTGGGYWGSRPPSPSGGDNASETSSVMPPPPPQQTQRPKSRAESKYDNLSYWRARKVTFFKNGDPYFPGVEYRFKPGRDIPSLEALQDKLSVRMDLPRGARYVFSMDGVRILTLDELEDNASYVVSSYKTFK